MLVMLMNKNKKIKKLNNKGFAISTVLYSLLIMVFLIVVLIMSIMASNRKSTHDLVETVEDDLNRYSVSNTKFEFSDVSDGNPKEYQVPNSGWYRIELWGASGGSTTSETGKEQAGGKGAYTSGVIYFDKGTLLYFYIGGTTTTATGGTNGGGNGGTKTGKGGGGSTDVRTKSGNWDLPESLQSRIMVAAGGGGADGLGDGSPGGEGGETFGASGSANKTKSDSAEYTNAKYGGQTGSKRWSFINIKQYSENCNGAVIKVNGNIFHRGKETEDYKTCGALGEGGGVPYDSGGGGGAGYVGGGAGNQYNDIAGSGAGGSSFIAGYSNMNYITTFKSGDEQALFVDDGRYFIDGQMTAGVNEGNGAARIEYISSNSIDNKPIKNEQLKNVRYIKDCSYGTVKDKTKVIWSEISAIDEDGKKVGFKTPSITGRTILTGSISNLTDKNLETSVEASKTEASEACLKVELSETSNLNEISVIHDWEKSDNPLIGHSLSVSSDNTNWTALIASESNTQENIIEKTSGTRYTNCNLNTSSNEIPDGVYYIYSALAPYNQALTAKNANDVTDTMDRSKQYVRIEPQQTTAIQEWAIGKIPNNSGYYKIVETSSNTALQVKDSLGQSDTQVNTASGYNDAYQWTQWQITSQKDGTYIIQGKIGSNYLTARTNSYYTSSDVKIMSKGTSGFLLSQRWILKPVNL